MTVRDAARLFVDRRFRDLEREVFEGKGTLRDQIELFRFLSGFAWGIPRAAAELQPKGQSAEEILQKIADARFKQSTPVAEVVSSETRPLLLDAAQELGAQRDAEFRELNGIGESNNQWPR